MLEPDRWPEVLGRLVGAVYRGTERIASGTIMNALGVPTDRWSRQKEGKRAGRVVLRENRARQHRPAGPRGNEAARPKNSLESKPERGGDPLRPAHGGERVPVVLIEGGNLHRTARHGAAECRPAPVQAR